MRQIRLVPVDAAMAEALKRGVDAVEAAYGARLNEEFLQHAQDIVAQTLALEQSRPRDPVFGGYLVVDVPARIFVGTCGFRDGPSADGSVELAYGTFSAFEGRGYATAAARALIGVASARPEVRRIIAHTLATPGPSPRILEKIGMRHLGEVIDPEDGPVWEFEIAPVRG